MVDLLLNGERPDLGDFTIQYCHPHTPATYVRGPGRRRRWEIAIGDLPDAEALAPKHIWQRLSRWLTPAEAEQFRSRVGCLSDDVTGYRSVMLVNCALLARMDGRALVEEKGIHVWHPDDLDGSADYLLELGAGAVAVRPDRYVCGAANDAAALDTLVRALPPNPARVQSHQ